MSPAILRTFNHFLGVSYSARQALAHVNAQRVLPLPRRLSLEDWRTHVPMHLLEDWDRLTGEERLAIFVMAQSATHLHEIAIPPEEPVLN